jgi:hypothetical protein
LVTVAASLWERERRVGVERHGRAHGGLGEFEKQAGVGWSSRPRISKAEAFIINPRSTEAITL